MGAAAWDGQGDSALQRHDPKAGAVPPNGPSVRRRTVGAAAVAAASADAAVTSFPANAVVVVPAFLAFSASSAGVAAALTAAAFAVCVSVLLLLLLQAEHGGVLPFPREYEGSSEGKGRACNIGCRFH